MHGIKTDKRVWQSEWGPNPYRFKSYRRQNARWLTHKNRVNTYTKRVIQAIKDVGRVRGKKNWNEIMSEVSIHLRNK